MVELEYFLVCRSIAADLESGDLTLCNVLEEVYPQYLPDYLERLAAVSSWRFSSDDIGKDYQAILKVQLPGEQQPSEFAMNFAEARFRYRAIQTVSFIPLQTDGVLVFEVYLNGKHQASHHVTIHPPTDGRLDVESELVEREGGEG